MPSLPTSVPESEVNDLLKFVFSPPHAVGKETLKKELKADWRRVIKAHCKLGPTQVAWIDGLSPAEAASILKSVLDTAAQGAVPRVHLKQGASADPLLQMINNNNNINKGGKK